MTTKPFVFALALFALAPLLAAPVLPGYLTDPSVMKKELASDKSYTPPDFLQYPYIGTEYVKPVVSPNEDVIIGCYVTDFHSSKSRFLDKSHRFTFTLEHRKAGEEAWKRATYKNLPSDTHRFSLGKLSEGDWEVRIWATDAKGRESHRVLHDIRVRKPARDIPTYTMTPDDLTKYGIRNDANLATVIWEGSNTTKNIRTKNPARPGYTVHVPLKGKVPVVRSFQKAKIEYDDGYDAAAMETEAVATAEGLQKFLDEKAAAGIRKIVLLKGTYLISAQRMVQMPDNLTLDMNGATFKQNGFTGCHSVIVKFPSAIDAVLENGTLEGDYYEHDYKNSTNNSEWPEGFEFGGSCLRCTVRNVKITHITGYGGSNGISKDKRGGLCYFYQGLPAFTAGGLDPKTGVVKTDDKYRFTCDFAPLAKVNKYGRIQISKYLGYQGRGTRSWTMTVCWYDAEKKFISGETAWQYREMFIPKGAAFLRCSVEDESAEKAKAAGLVITRFRIPTNCTIERNTFALCRCVGYAASAFKNILFLENRFTASGESAAKCAFDAEDGWDQMQDAYFLRNCFRGNPLNNSILTCCGHNFILEDNECAIHFWGRTHSPCIRNSKISNLVICCDSRIRSGYTRLENNVYSGYVELGRSNDKPDNWDCVISGLELDGAKGDKGANFVTGPGGRMVGCSFKNMCARIGNAYGCTFENCTGDFYPGGKWVESTVKSCKFRYFYGYNLFTRCHFSDTYIQGFRNGHFNTQGGEFANCHFQDLELTDFNFTGTRFDNTFFAFGYWNKPGKAKFEKCAITTPAKCPFVTIPLYTIGDWKFDGCKVDGQKELMHIGDLRPQPTDGQPGYIRMNNCTWKATAPKAVTRSGDNVSPKKIYFEETKMRWPKTAAFTDAKLPATWSFTSNGK